MNETLHTIAGRPVLRIERRLAHPPEKVWRAITEPAHLSQWYPFAAAAIDLRVGGAIRFDDGQGTTMDATIVELDPPRIFAFSERAPADMSRESNDLVHFELHPDGQGCLLIFTHTFDDRPAAASYASGWHTCLAALDRVLAGQPIEPPADMNRLHQHYIEAFGLAVGSTETTPEGWRVRFERQLTKPIEAVWARLTAAHSPTVGEPVPPGFTTSEVVAGAITAVEAPTMLEYGWRSGDRSAGLVRWELSNGTGHGARLVLSQTGPSTLAAEQPTALAAWQSHIEELAKQLLVEPRAASPNAPGELSPTEDGRFAVRFERRLAHPPAKVWRAITEPEHLRAWFPAIVQFDLRPGARLRFEPTPEQQARYGLPDLAATTTNGQVTRVDPPHLLEYTWNEEILRWELRDDGAGGCLLVFTNIFDDRDAAVNLSAGWHAGLEVVAAQLDGRAIDWSPWDRAELLADEYAESVMRDA
jgi:uncharacterized protein YndB with AHSA1/START domain